MRHDLRKQRAIRFRRGDGDQPSSEDSGKGILPTRDSPSVITTVTGNPVKGSVSESEAEASAVETGSLKETYIIHKKEVMNHVDRFSLKSEKKRRRVSRYDGVLRDPAYRKRKTASEQKRSAL